MDSVMESLQGADISSASAALDSIASGAQTLSGGMQALNGKGKNEKKVKKAKKLAVTFTIPQNNSTPVGEKTIWLRITTPEGQLLDGGGSFSFEGGTLASTAHRTIEYGGQEIGGVTIYYDVRQALNPGAYTVELFCDNFRLKSTSFTLK